MGNGNFILFGGCQFSCYIRNSFQQSILVKMSCQNRDPLEKQDTSSESGESHSDSGVNETEENLEHLELRERLVEEEQKHNGKSKLLVSQNQEETTRSKYDPLNEPTPGPSGLQKPPQSSFDSSSDSKPKYIALSRPEKNIEQKGIDENIGFKIMGADTDTTESMPPSSTSSAAAPALKKKMSAVPSSRLRHGKRSGFVKSTAPLREVLKPFFGSSQRSSSSSNVIYAADSANTLSDISEIPSEVGDLSAEGSVYHDALETFERDQTPSYKSALEEQISESSDTSISESLDEFSPSLTTGSSASISTPSGGGGNRDYIAECQREADERGEPPSTSSGIASTDPSELANLEHWGLAGEMGFYRRNVDDISDSQNLDFSEHGAQVEEPQTTSEPMEDQSILEHRGVQDFDRLFQQNEENLEESNVPGHGASIDTACGIQKSEKRIPVSETAAGFPSDRRGRSNSSESSSAAKDAAGQLKSRVRPSFRKKSKVVAMKSNDPLQSSSESTEPKSTSSDEPHRKESPEMESSSESSITEPGRKSWQKPGLLRGSQFPTISSKDSVITEEDEDKISPSSPKLMETEGECKEKFETTPEDNECAAASTEASESHLSASSDQAIVSETEGALKEHELSFEVEEFERTAGKSKREAAKLSGSPPSDEILGSSPPKATTLRPLKKARSDQEPEKTCKTEHDSTDAHKRNESSTPSDSDNESSDESERKL